MLTKRCLETIPLPFPHFVWPNIFGQGIPNKIVSWLRSTETWNLKETDFYEQYEFSLLDHQPPSELQFLTDPHFLQNAQRIVARAFDVKTLNILNICAHKLAPRQTIRLHNDYIPAGATHRLLVQLTQVDSLDDGGLLMFFNSNNSADLAKVFLPESNLGIGFSVSQNSYHAVSTQHFGERFTLVFAFSDE